MTQAVTPSRTEVPLEGFAGQVLAALGGAVIAVERCDQRRGRARIDPERTLEVARKMFAMEGSRFATATGIDVRDGIDVLYHWCIEPPGVVITLKCLATRPEITLDSIASQVPAANWIEREMHDLLGVNFRNHPDMRRLILDDSWPEGVYPLRKDFDQGADRPPLPPVPPAPEDGLS
jgi:Ni,Fe-hydrogenase III component G